MWTSSILIILSMFTAEAAEVGNSIRSLAAELQAAPVETADVAIAKPVISKAQTSRSKGPVAKAKSAAPKLAVVPAPEPEPILAEPLAEPVVAISALPSTFVTAQPMLKVAPPTKAQEIVAKVQTFYNTTQSFTASFSQTVKNSTFAKLKPKVSSGKVYILKPGKMRWDYKNAARRDKSDPKVSKSFISDGNYLWAVMHKNKQFYKESLAGSALPVAVSFLMGTGNLLNDFNVTLETPGKFGSKNDILLLLTPKVPSARYKKLWLVVDPQNHSVKQSVVLNSKGDTNAIVFSNVVLDSGKLRKGHFIFNEAANKDFTLIKPPQNP